MDHVKKFTTSELIILGGAVLVFIGTFMKWFKVDSSFGDVSVNGFEYFFQGTIPWLLAIATAAVVIIRRVAPTVKLPDLPMPWSQVILIASGLIAVLILTRIASTDGPSEFVDRGLGIFLACLGGLAMAAGAVLKFMAKDDEIGPSTSGPATPF